jgi:SAM-dependent methyltransferase
MAWQEKLPDAVKWGLVPYTRGMGLEVGCGPKKTFPHFVGVDSLPNTRLFGSHVQPDMVVKNVGKLPQLAGAQYDFVFAPQHPNASHEVAFEEWWRVLKTDGHLCLYWPDTAEPEMKIMVQGWDLVVDETVEGGRFQVYRKLDAGGHSPNKASARGPKPQKTVAVIRLGAFGDLVQASSVLPGLKAEGYHLTLYTAPRGFDVVKHDPNIDAFVIQDPDQVPIGELGDFWKWLKTRYTRFVNLSSTVEGTLLAVPGSAVHEWPHALRHALLDVNYLEVVHAVAGVPFPSKQKFYATDMEIAWAKKERQKMGGSKVILWTLSGSSIHKTWPYLDQIIARTLRHAPRRASSWQGMRPARSSRRAGSWKSGCSSAPAFGPSARRSHSSTRRTCWSGPRPA